MNDRFKFRAYSKKHKKIYEVMEIGFHWETKKPSNVTLEIPDNDDWELLENLDNIILMQSTGLKDKNGKLIYEGDIVKFNFDTDEIIAVVSWDDNEGQVGYYLNTTDYFKDKYVTDYDFYKNDYEVLGNIYENKELLESEG